MIFYFSGTGNSLYAAKTLGEKLQEPIMDIAASCQSGVPAFNYTPSSGEKIGFVFPVYAWQPPLAVGAFVKKLNLKGSEVPYTFAVCTMGESAGRTMETMKHWLSKKNILLNSGYSLIMPDNYVPGFDVDSREKEEEKLAHASFMLQKIGKAIVRERQNFFPVKKGSMSVLKSGIVNTVFNKYATKTKAFYVTGECIGCGLCQSICTSACIHMKDDRPSWDKKRCNMCTACINRCPKHAIQYGKKTEARGRYVHPDL